jgi:membrane-associated protease RseP (regulator of RpoE activity)
VEPPATHAPVPGSVPPPRRSRRWRFHLLLFAATFLTLAAAGGLSWEPSLLEMPPGLGTRDGLLWLVSRPLVIAGILRRGLSYAAWVAGILGSHELGHYVACRAHGIPATLPYFIPGVPPIGTFGAVIRIRGPIPNRNALFDVAAAGPLAGFAVALVWGLRTAQPVGPEALGEGGLFLGQPLVVALMRPLLVPGAEHFFVNSVFVAGWVGVLVTSLNLFPVGQLDGGHAAYAVSRRVHRAATRLTLVGMLGVIGLQLLARQVPSYLLWFLVLLWMRDRHPHLIDESAPLGRGRRILAVLLALLFAMCFLPFPFELG